MSLTTGNHNVDAALHPDLSPDANPFEQLYFLYDEIKSIRGQLVGTLAILGAIGTIPKEEAEIHEFVEDDPTYCPHFEGWMNPR